MRVLKLLPVLAALALASPARAVSGRSFLGDDNVLFTARWEVAEAVNELRNTISQLSLEGASGDFRVALGKSNFSFGVALGWNRLYGGTPYTVVEAASPMAVLHGYLSRSGVQPYLGVGAGGAYTRTTIGSAPYVPKWGFAVDPQLGLLVTITPELALDLRLHYEWTTVQTSVAKNYQWAGVGIGFAFY